MTVGEHLYGAPERAMKALPTTDARLDSDARPRRRPNSAGRRWSSCTRPRLRALEAESPDAGAGDCRKGSSTRGLETTPAYAWRWRRARSQPMLATAAGRAGHASVRAGEWEPPAALAG